MTRLAPSTKLRISHHKIATRVIPASAKKLPVRLSHSGGRTGRHSVPADLRKVLIGTPAALAVWKDITPLARNEWICWIISGKKAETRNIRIAKGLSKLKGGMRRPCCWAGCPHR